MAIKKVYVVIKTVKELEELYGKDASEKHTYVKENGMSNSIIPEMWKFCGKKIELPNVKTLGDVMDVQRQLTTGGGYNLPIGFSWLMPWIKEIVIEN
jgi:hypothetical protein